MQLCSSPRSVLPAALDGLWSLNMSLENWRKPSLIFRYTPLHELFNLRSPGLSPLFRSSRPHVFQEHIPSVYGTELPILVSSTTRLSSPRCFQHNLLLLARYLSAVPYAGSASRINRTLVSAPTVERVLMYSRQIRKFLRCCYFGHDWTLRAL
jgi:hypothetical protein